MSEGETILGTSKIDPRYRITLIQPLPDLLGITDGDLIVFVRDRNGNIMIKASQVSKVKIRKEEKR
ncbi:MAG: AbrB/MazE/SpoVT family DNA-binding domain-containing protein [Thaumarchaeota archaeon]|nr:AbrB/MazE/SpoVT family DNA-binding domain-containing protein [Nitrososphaerota archaeon]